MGAPDLTEGRETREGRASTVPRDDVPQKRRSGSGPATSKRKPSGIPAGRALHDVERHSVSTRIRFPEPRCQHEQTSPTLPPSGLAADADGLGPPLTLRLYGML